MKVLIACEYSGTVRDAFARLGHDAWSCDTLPTEAPGQHYQCDAREVLGLGWDLMVCHPPCQYLSYAGLRHWKAPGRAELRAQALAFCLELYHAPIPLVALENPKGYLGQAFMPATQYVNPFQFGDPYRKRTGLWLKNLPPLVPTEIVKPAAPYSVEPGKGKNGKDKHRHHTDSMKSAKERARFFPGMAAAMAQQWGNQARLARAGTQGLLF